MGFKICFRSYIQIFDIHSSVYLKIYFSESPSATTIIAPRVLFQLFANLPGNEDGNSWIPHGNIRTEVLAIFLAFLYKRTLCSLVASKELTVTGSVLFNYLVATGKCCCWGVQFWADKFEFPFRFSRIKTKLCKLKCRSCRLSYLSQYSQHLRLYQMSSNSFLSS